MGIAWALVSSAAAPRGHFSFGPWSGASRFGGAEDTPRGPRRPGEWRTGHLGRLWGSAGIFGSRPGLRWGALPWYSLPFRVTDWLAAALQLLKAAPPLDHRAHPFGRASPLHRGPQVRQLGVGNGVGGDVDDRPVPVPQGPDPGGELVDARQPVQEQPPPLPLGHKAQPALPPPPTHSPHPHPAPAPPP